MIKMSEEMKKNEAVKETTVNEETKEEIKEECKDEKKVEPQEEDEVTKLNKQIETLQSENDELQNKVAGLKNAYAKAYADTENMKKRLNNDFEMRNKYRAQDFAKEILPVLDNCERALASDSTDENYRKAFEMVHKQLVKALEKEGVVEIDCLNKPFDPNFHQAVLTEKDANKPSNVILEVLQKGYTYKDKVIRPAMVKVNE